MRFYLRRNLEALIMNRPLSSSRHELSHNYVDLVNQRSQNAVYHNCGSGKLSSVAGLDLKVVDWILEEQCKRSNSCTGQGVTWSEVKCTQKFFFIDNMSDNCERAVCVHLQRRRPPVWETTLSLELSCYCWGEIALAPSAQFVCLNPTRAQLRQKPVYL